MNSVFEVQLLAITLISPLIILNIIFIYYCRKRKVWSYAGASILGALGVILRVIVSTQPNLEVGGGLPVGITVLYIVRCPGCTEKLRSNVRIKDIGYKCSLFTYLTGSTLIHSSTPLYIMEFKHMKKLEESYP